MKTHSSFSSFNSVECSWSITFDIIAIKEDSVQIEDDTCRLHIDKQISKRDYKEKTIILK